MFVFVGAVVVAERNLRIEEEFTNFEARFNKRYSDPIERSRRLEIFASNLAGINAHNSGGHPWTQAVNHFSDLTLQEWRAHVFGNGSGGLRSSPPSPAKTPYTEPTIRLLQTLPASVDWVSAGAVTPVKDQGGCGSCWAFATVGAIEGAVAVATGQLTALSEQQIVSCEVLTGDGNSGCSGGDAGYAMRWVASAAGGLCSEASWP